MFAFLHFRKAFSLKIVAIAIGVLATAQSAAADVAVAADPFASTSFILAPGRTAGWAFQVNAPLEVTSLGLYDSSANGFQISYQIGIWNSSGSLLISSTIASGNAAPLIDGLRYINLDDTGVLLLPNETYTIGYYASSIAPSDTMINFSGASAFSPWVTPVGGAVVTDGAFGQLMMPTVSFQRFEQWIGPGFQFNIVPAPGGIAAMILLTASGRRRRSREGTSCRLSTLAA